MVTPPTAPVAPTTPIRASVDDEVKLERLVERADGPADVPGRDMAGDLDRRGGHDLDGDSLGVQRGERLRGDPGMALHSRPDQAHLPEVVARRPLDAEAVGDGLDVRPGLGRRREDDLGGRLGKGVGVYAPPREGGGE